MRIKIYYCFKNRLPYFMGQFFLTLHGEVIRLIAFNLFPRILSAQCRGAFFTSAKSKNETTEKSEFKQGKQSLIFL